MSTQSDSIPYSGTPGHIPRLPSPKFNTLGAFAAFDTCQGTLSGGQAIAYRSVIIWRIVPASCCTFLRVRVGLWVWTRGPKKLDAAIESVAGGWTNGDKKGPDLYTYIRVLYAAISALRVARPGGCGTGILVMPYSYQRKGALMLWDQLI